jgi:hypothetical protein
MKRAGEEILSFRRAAVRIGWEDSNASERRLRDLVRGHERRTRKRVTVPRGPAGGWRGVTMAGLRQHFPWLFKAGSRERSELEQRFQEHLKDIATQAEDVASAVVAKLVDPQIDELHGRCTRSDRRVDAIERRIAAVSLRVGL